MRKVAVLLALLMTVAGVAVPAFAADYDRYDRYERYPDPPPPPAPRAASAPPRTHLNYGPGYFGLQMGFFEPNDDFEGLATYDTGFAFNVMFGSRLTPFFALEGSIGYFEAQSDFFQGDLSVVPLTIGGRFIIPNPVVEPYIGAGFGVYFASLDENFGVDDDSTDFGGYLSFGIDFWLNPKVALNLEGRYQWIESEFDGFDVDLSGWNALFGVRVSF